MNKNSLLNSAIYLANIMDEQFQFGKIKFGLDPLLDFIPWLGDVVGLLISLYIIWVGTQLKVPQDKVSQMVGNVVIDFIISLIPGIGIIGDMFYKANVKNVEIIKEFAPNIVEGKVAST